MLSVYHGGYAPPHLVVRVEHRGKSAPSDENMLQDPRRRWLPRTYPGTEVYPWANRSYSPDLDEGRSRAAPYGADEAEAEGRSRAAGADEAVDEGRSHAAP